MGKSFLRFVLLSSPLLLTACGEGWEVKRIDNVQPYKTRTAGTGVAYVLAKMMPEKELNLEPVTAAEPAAVAVEEPKKAVQPVLDAEEIFNEAQGKGHASSKASAPEAVNEDAAISVAQEVLETPQQPAAYVEPVRPAEVEQAIEDVQEAVDEKAVDAVEEEMPAAEEEDHSSLEEQIQHDVIKTASARTSADITIPELSAEEFIEQAPRTVEIPQLEVREVKAAKLEPAAHNIEIYENTISEPEKELMVPKKDFFSLRSVGQDNLDEIYSDPF